MVIEAEAAPVPHAAVEYHVAPEERISRWSEIPNPSLYLLNIRVWLSEQSDSAGLPLRLIDIPDETWKQFARDYDGIWFLGIYKPSEAAKIHAMSNIERYRPGFPLITPGDIAASPFAISAYEPNPEIASDWNEWDTFREKLNTLGIAAIGDFVPNHVALDHPWTWQHPEYFIEIPAPEGGKTPSGFYKCILPDESVHYYAHGKDPNNDPWLDTLQLNYTNPELQQEMIKQLELIAEHFDGVRADMAMLLDPGTFYRTWGWVIGARTWPGDFWPRAIAAAKAKATEKGKEFTVWSEAYWEKEVLLGAGQERVYAKDLYDLLIPVIRDGMSPRDQKFIDKLYACASRQAVVFTENHDEHRATEMFGGEQQAKAALVLLAFLGPSALMIHQGQEFGFTKKLPMQVKMSAKEEVDREFAVWHAALLKIRREPLFRGGKWNLESAWSSGMNGDHHDRVVAQHWKRDGKHALVCVNTYKETASAHIPVPHNAEEVYVFDVDHMNYLDNTAIAELNGDGLFVELQPHHSQIVFYTTPTAV